MAASSRTGMKDTFAAHLQQATACEPPAATPPVEATPEEPTPVDEPAAEHRQEEEAAPEQVAETTDAGARAPSITETPAHAGSEAQPQSTCRGEPELRIDAGKDSGSPGISKAPMADGLPAAVVAKTSNQPGAQPGILPGGAAAAAKANGATVAAANGRLELATALKSGPVRASAAPTGYRTLNTQAVQLVEQARDSVFKQILFKLDQGGGEMRLRLEPPELGELDLRLVVENGNQLRLSIGAERQDLAQMLNRDLDQLRHALQQHGLQITHAEVHTGTGSPRDGSAAQDQYGRPTNDQRDQAPVEATARAHGFSTAQGLDFWA